MTRLWGRWAAVQFVAIFCLTHAVFLFICGITRTAFGSSTAQYAPHMLLLAVLFYALHWRFQGWAYQLDPVRSDRLVTAIKARSSKLDPEW